MCEESIMIIPIYNLLHSIVGFSFKLTDESRFRRFSPVFESNNIVLLTSLFYLD